MSATITNPVPSPGSRSGRTHSRPRREGHPTTLPSMWTTFGGTPADLRKRIAARNVPPTSEVGGTHEGERKGVRPPVTLRP